MIYPARIGGAALFYQDEELQHTPRAASLTQLGTLTAMADNQTYTLSENVQVLLRGTGSTGYYSTTLSEINASDYTLTGWYDDFGYSAGGRIWIIVAVPNS